MKILPRYFVVSGETVCVTCRYAIIDRETGNAVYQDDRRERVDEECRLINAGNPPSASLSNFKGR